MTGFKLKATLFGVPILFVIIVFGLVNIKPMYKTEALLVCKISAVGKLDRTKLRQYNRTYRRFIRKTYRANMLFSSTQRHETLEILRSREYAKQVLHEYNLKTLLFPKRWNKEEKKWMPRKKSVLEGIFYLINKAPKKKMPVEPLDWKAVKRLQKSVRVNLNEKTGLIKLSMRWRNPEDAYTIVNAFIEHANVYFSSRNRVYMLSMLDRIQALQENQTVPEVRKILLNQMEFVQSKLGLISPEFDPMVTILSPPYVPEKRVIKVPLFLLAFSGIFSFILTGLYCLHHQFSNIESTKNSLRRI